MFFCSLLIILLWFLLSICLSNASFILGATFILTLPFLERLERQRSSLYYERSVLDLLLLLLEETRNLTVPVKALFLPRFSV